MKIRTVAIIGLGALGTMFAKYFSDRLPKDDRTWECSALEIWRQAEKQKSNFFPEL